MVLGNSLGLQKESTVVISELSSSVKDELVAWTLGVLGLLLTGSALCLLIRHLVCSHYRVSHHHSAVL